jgi:hypothetical protein
VAALLSLVVGTILFKRLRPSCGLWVSIGMQNLVGGLALAPFALGFELVSEVVLSWRLLLALTYLALLVSVLAFLIWIHLWPLYCELRDIGPAVWLEKYGMLALTRYDAVMKALRIGRASHRHLALW